MVSSCVHCHQIGDAFRTSFREQKKPIPSEWIYPQPAPETIGMTLAPDYVARVSAVRDASPAAKAGIQAGDEIVSLAGQPLVSMADVSWILHRFAEGGQLAAVVKRAGMEHPVNLTLPTGWREKADISKRVGTWTMRAMALGGLVLEDLADDARSVRALGKSEMALLIKFVGQYGNHAAGKNAGFRKDDIIVELDGKADRTTESELIGKLLHTHPVGARVKAVVLRGEQRVNLTLPIQ